MKRFLMLMLAGASLAGCSHASVVTITDDGTTTNVSAWSFISKIDAAIFSATTETRQGENFWKSSSGSAVEGVDTASGVNDMLRLLLDMAVKLGAAQAGIPIGGDPMPFETETRIR